jgi:hypothetical protein
MLSAIGRAAVRRVVAGGTQSTNQALRSIWHIQRVDSTQNASNTSSGPRFTLPIRRLYATTTKATTIAKPKTTKAKPKAKKAAPKKKAVKKPVKKVVKKKAKPKAKPVKKVKKVLTEAQKSKLAATKERVHLKELKELALSPPPRTGVSAWNVVLAELAKTTPQTAGQRVTVATIAKDASAKYKSLTPAELEVRPQYT